MDGETTRHTDIMSQNSLRYAIIASRCEND